MDDGLRVVTTERARLVKGRWLILVETGFS